MSGVSLALALGAGPASWDLVLGVSWRTRETRIMRQYFEANIICETEKGVLLMSGCVMFVVTCFRAL